MKRINSVIKIGIGILVLPILPLSLNAHCDAWDGPLVLEAREAFRQGEVEPVVKWVSPERETEIRGAFEKSLAVAQESDAAGELAELWFLETLVRIHREGEGAPYTGLKPAGQINPAVQLADEALATGSAEALAERISRGVANQILQRYEKAAAGKTSASDSPEAGREFVDAYVQYIHFVEAVHDLLQHGGQSH